MTNFQKLTLLNSDDFVDKIKDIFDTPFYAHIDWKAYMKGESEKVTDYLISKEKCKVIPCEAEIINNLGINRTIEAEIKYIADHTKEMIVIDKDPGNKIYNNRVVTVADIENNILMKVQYTSVIFESEGK